MLVRTVQRHIYGFFTFFSYLFSFQLLSAQRIPRSAHKLLTGCPCGAIFSSLFLSFAQIKNDLFLNYPLFQKMILRFAQNCIMK
jgi:hypothetical protein